MNSLSHNCLQVFVFCIASWYSCTMNIDGLVKLISIGFDVDHCSLQVDVGVQFCISFVLGPFMLHVSFDGLLFCIAVVHFGIRGSLKRSLVMPWARYVHFACFSCVLIVSKFIC